MNHSRKPDPERNAQIYDDYKAGAKWKEMSDYYCLGIQRLQLIVKEERKRRLESVGMKLAQRVGRTTEKDTIEYHDYLTQMAIGGYPVL